jgi:hypothetical protein
MPTFNGNTIDNDFLYVVVSSTQNQALNRSTISWSLYWAFRSPAPTDRDLDNASLSISRLTSADSAVVVYSSANPYNYVGNFTVRNLLLRSGSTVRTHDADGNLTVSISGTCTPWQNPASKISGSYVLPRIPKVPGQPGRPTADTLSSIAGRVSLSWSEPDDDGGATIDGYNIYTASSGSLLATTSGTGTTTNLSLTVGTTLAFYVKAFNSVGESEQSLSSGSITVDGNPTAAPTLSSLTNAGTTTSGDLIATWTAPAASPTAITKYSIEVSTNNSTWTLSKTVNAPTLSTTLTELSSEVPIPANTLIYARVRARNAFSDRNFTTANPQWSSASNSRNATSSGPPGAPTGLSAQNTSDLGTVPANAIKLTWIAPVLTGNPAGITGYNVYWYKDSEPETVFSASVGNVLTYTTPANLSPEPASYDFYVVAKNSLSSGQQGWSVNSEKIENKVAITPGGWEDNSLNPTMRVGVVYSDQIEFEGSYTEHEVTGTTPPGLSFSGPVDNVLTLSGTPTAQGTYTFTVTVTVAGPEDVVQEFTLDVLPGGYRKSASSQVPITILKRFDGTSWIDVASIKKWNGSAFVNTGIPSL